jgi:hypothetical protein
MSFLLTSVTTFLLQPVMYYLTLWRNTVQPVTARCTIWTAINGDVGEQPAGFNIYSSALFSQTLPAQ